MTPELIEELRRPVDVPRRGAAEIWMGAHLDSMLDNARRVRRLNRATGVIELLLGDAVVVATVWTAMGDSPMRFVLAALAGAVVHATGTLVAAARV